MSAQQIIEALRQVDLDNVPDQQLREQLQGLAQISSHLDFSDADAAKGAE